MDNRIGDVIITDKRLDPAESEIHIAVYPERLTPTTQVKGRLMGPSSPYASTVEVAYHLREVSRGSDHILSRVIIPEPCLWDPQQPFLYQGPIELWQDGVRCERKPRSHALRKVRLSTQQLRINGGPTVLRGTCRMPQSIEEARSLHERGFNLLVFGSDCSPSRLLTERFGYLSLLRCVKATGDISLSAEHDGLALWNVPGEIVGEAPLPRYCRLGVELHASPECHFPPDDVSFVICPEETLDVLADIALPKLVLTDKLPPRHITAPSGVVGWIER